MLFNSIEFLLFLPIVYLLYWFVTKGNRKIQNVLLLVASYVFYGWWDWRFVFLLMLSTLIDYFFGILIHDAKSAPRKKLFLWLSVINNLGILAYFKYYNFFIDSALIFLNGFGFSADISLLSIVLPVGISFYTFHGMSYVFDIYRGQVTPTRNFIDYALFVCFFPLLVAGPIERANHLLPQIINNRFFSYNQSVGGLRLILYGLFKKIVIADAFAPLANQAFADNSLSSLSLAIGIFAFAMQIYGDFSGYSDMAVGTAKLFGFELLRNFRFPYFSRNIAEFWKRWHISLSSWFRDYLYIPLGGSKEGQFKAIRNVFIIFLVSGLWHGASWNFVIWGAIHACLFLPAFILGKDGISEVIAYNSTWPSMKEIFQVCVTFLFVCIAWIFFRAPTLVDALGFLNGLLSFKAGGMLTMPMENIIILIPAFLYFIVKEWKIRHNADEPFIVKSDFWRRAEYQFVALLIVSSFRTSDTFIYFQF